MTMSNYEIALRNLFSTALPGWPKELIESLPVDRADNPAIKILDTLLDGPFGKISIDGQCDCKACEGVAIALRHVRTLLATTRVPQFPDEVLELLSQYITSLQRGVDDIEDQLLGKEDEPEAEDEGEPTLFNYLKSMFPNATFTVVRPS